MRTSRKSIAVILSLAAALMLGGPAAWGAAADQHHRSGVTSSQHDALAEHVRHQLAMLPYYSVFDNLEFRVDGSHVTLMGQVTRPILKSSAEAVVKKVEGVSSVTDDIEVLPVSIMDDQIRRAEFRAIYGESQLTKYGVGSEKAIRIIVKNGHVTLEGIVDNDVDRNVANLRANSVPGVFSVTNNLVVRG